MEDGLADGGHFPDPANDGLPAAGIDFITVKEAEVGSVDEELVGFLGGMSFFEEVGEGELAGADGINEFPRALSGAEDMEEVLVSEDFWEVRNGAVLGDADMGAVLEVDGGFLGAV